MGQQDIALQGYPRTHLKKDWTYFQYCGGSGAIGPLVLQNQNQVVCGMDVNPYITINRDLILFTNSFQIYSDPAGNTPAQWWLALGATNSLTPAQILAQNNPFTNAGNTSIELLRAKLPQPTDAGWSSKIYVYIYWGPSPTYAYTQYLDQVQYFTPTKFDFDVRQ